jgi:hypothetical protein
MNNMNPNRVNAGKAGAGQFDFKCNSEADIELVDMEFGDGVYGDYPHNYDTVMELESAYMEDIEADPTHDGLMAAIRKYRREAVRFELELKSGDANRDNYPDKEWFNLPENHGMGMDETDDEEFYLTPALLEVRAVARINEIRQQQLEAQYGKYRSEFAEGSPEIQISTTTEHGKWTGYVEQKMTEDDRARNRIVGRAITSTDAETAINEVKEVVKQSRGSGIGAAYRITRKGFDTYTGEPEFNEVLVVPSEREVERINLGTKAISEGWL